MKLSMFIFGSIILVSTNVCLAMSAEDLLNFKKEEIKREDTIGIFRDQLSFYKTFDKQMDLASIIVTTPPVMNPPEPDPVPVDSNPPATDCPAPVVCVTCPAPVVCPAPIVCPSDQDDDDEDDNDDEANSCVCSSKFKEKHLQAWKFFNKYNNKHKKSK